MTQKRHDSKRSRRGWSFSAGQRGANRVRVYDRGERGIYLDYTDSDGKRVREPLHHADRARAKAQAEDLAARFRQRAAKPTRLTLGTLFDMYEREVSPQKGESSREHDARTAEMLSRFFRADREPRTLSRREWDRFIEARRRGEIRPRTIKNARPVANRVIEHDLKFLLAVLNWATVAGDGHGAPLLDRNPLKGMPLPAEKNPRRPALTAEQYRAMLAVADQVHPFMRTLLVLAYETGHRIGSIRHLRWGDVDTQHAVVLWRAEHDKEGFAHETPLAAAAVEALTAHRKACATIGDGWIFPFSRDGDEPITRNCVNKWWAQAARIAELPKGERFGWHSARRAWASGMRDVNPRDLCDLGGWKSYETPLRCYIKPSLDAQRAALAQRRELAANG